MPYKPTGRPPGRPRRNPEQARPPADTFRIEPMRGVGRPEFEPTPEHRGNVELMIAYGIPQDEIATALGITPPTLRKHFFREIDTGATKANAKVAQSLFLKATAGNGKESVTAAIFWLRCRAGWREAMGSDQPGKKEQADMRAVHAESGTSWEGLLN